MNGARKTASCEDLKTRAERREAESFPGEASLQSGERKWRAKWRTAAPLLDSRSRRRASRPPTGTQQIDPEPLVAAGAPGARRAGRRARKVANALRPVWRAPRNSWAQREVHEDPGDLPAASRIAPSAPLARDSAFSHGARRSYHGAGELTDFRRSARAAAGAARSTGATASDTRGSVPELEGSRCSRCVLTAHCGGERRKRRQRRRPCRPAASGPRVRRRGRGGAAAVPPPRHRAAAAAAPPPPRRRRPSPTPLVFQPRAWRNNSASRASLSSRRALF